MDGDDTQYSLRVAPKLAAIEAAAWDACAGPDNPFVSYAFLSALEDSGSANARSGWQPQHLSLAAPDGRIVACAPLYLKSHSYGEYVFDHGWAEAYERAGGEYYPKLQCAVPFSPVPGPRLLIHPEAPPETSRLMIGGMVELARRLDVSSLHITFRLATNGTSSVKPGCCSASASNIIGKIRAMAASTISSARSIRASARPFARSGARRSTAAWTSAR